MTYQPPAGSVDAWVYGSTALGGTDGEPSFSPSAVRATNTSVVTTSPTPSPIPSPSPNTGATSPPPARSSTSPPKPSPTVGQGRRRRGARVPPEQRVIDQPDLAGDRLVDHTDHVDGQWPTTTTTDHRLGLPECGVEHRRTVDAEDRRRHAGGRRPSVVGVTGSLDRGVMLVVALAAVADIVAWRRRRAG